jgi:hypothetical protein
MDAIERLFGIAPDGGSGVIEALLLLLPLAASLLLARHRGRREQPSRPPARETGR